LELEVIRDDENPLLDRRELMLKISGTTTTPARRVLREKIAALYDVGLENVVVEKIITEFGRQDVVVDARIYPDPATAERIENSYLLDRGKKDTEEEVVAEE